MKENVHYVLGCTLSFRDAGQQLLAGLVPNCFKMFKILRRYDCFRMVRDGLPRII